MANTITISVEKSLHEDYKRFCIDNGLKVSTEISRFMQMELDGKEKRFLALEESVNKLLKLAGESVNKEEQGDNF